VLDASSAPVEAGFAAARPARRLAAVIRTARPRQWPKNLLVFAAPLAGASLGRNDGFGYALVAFAAFVAASSAVYFVNDVADAAHDRLHPQKRFRAVASGQLSASQALTVAAALAIGAEAGGLIIGEPRLCLVITVYLLMSVLYSLLLKQVPVVELGFVASGFVLRALGGAYATHVPPSGWFLLVCSLGALMVAIAKRSVELQLLGQNVVRHRPVMRRYTAAGLLLGQRVIAVAIISAYICWALGDHTARMRAWHLLSGLPLAAALIRFQWLTARPTTRPVEDLIARDVPMLGLELAWLVLFVIGL
jgi:decaprenyl-phosphate phosphoribosyltransferase